MTLKANECFIIMCDNKGCDNKFQCQDINSTWPGMWCAIEIKGWCGEFHVCGHRCETKLRERLENKG